MVDEAHERSLSSDILLGILKKVRKRRPELRIVVSSATLQAEEFVRFFTGRNDNDGKVDAPIQNDIVKTVSIEGRAYPVDVHYLTEACEDYLERAAKTVFDIHASEPEGDILVFVTGRDDIDTLIDKLADRIPSLLAQADKILPLPLYAGLTIEQQIYVFEPAPENTRKVICATNIAEASVTIDGIAYVVDTGFVKLRAYNPRTGIDTLTATAVSKASATQRCGRAGRTKPGKCYRLYTQEAFASLPSVTIPEIQRSNLAPVILQLKALGIDNIARFDFLTAPPTELIIRALEILYSLGALDEYAKLTRPLGMRMAEIALEPMLSKCVLSSTSFGCVNEMLSIAAMISLQGHVWFTHDNKKAEETARRKFAVEEGDHLTLLNVYTAFVTKGKRESKWCQQHYLNYQSLSRAVSIRNQLRRYLERFGIKIPEFPATNHPAGPLSAGDIPMHERIRRCLTSGYFAHAAKMQSDGTFRTVEGGMVLHAHPSSLMFNRKAEWVIFTEAMETGEKTFIRDVSKIEKRWLGEYAPEYYRLKT